MTDAGSNTVCRFYANGNMRGKLKVRIEARSDGKPYTLSPSELKKVRLVDYDHGKDLSSLGYTVSMEKGEFSDSFPGTMMQAGLQPCSDGHITERWVSIQQEQGVQLKIAAMVEQPDGQKISTRGRTDEGERDTNVMLKGEAPIIHTTDTILMQSEDIKSVPNSWYQENYYVSTKNHPLLKAEIHLNINTEGCYASQFRDSCLKSFYIWDYGNQTTKQLKYFSIFGDKIIDITVNQKPQALCLTRMRFKCLSFTSSLYTQYTHDAWFKLYDEYGNTGTFSASYDDEHCYNVVIRSRNTLMTDTKSFTQSSPTLFKVPEIDLNTSQKDDTLSKETEQKPNLGSKG